MLTDERTLHTGDIGTLVLQNGQEIIGEVVYQDSLATSIYMPMFAYFDASDNTVKVRPFTSTGERNLGLDKRGNKQGIGFTHDMVVVAMKSTDAGTALYTAALGE